MQRLRVLVAGVSTRAIAESAARAGFDVVALDAFADLDQHPAVDARSVPRDFDRRFTAAAAAQIAHEIPSSAVAYTSPFENHPNAVNAIAATRLLWGNPPAVVRAVRDPMRLSRVLRRHGIDAPAVRMHPVARGEWVLKPLASGGGRGVRRWHRGARVARGSFLQELVLGNPGSIAFVAAKGRAVPIGLSRQLCGDAAFGAVGFQYCGSILDVGRCFAAAARAARVVAREFDLVGVNGMDFIAREGHVHPIEVNPRWSASMELIERAYGLTMFGSHVRACEKGILPDFDLVSTSRALARTFGKAIVFARRDIVVRDTAPWLRSGDIRDVPLPGEVIRAGRPICTVFADGRDVASCYLDLVRCAHRIYVQAGAWERRVA